MKPVHALLIGCLLATNQLAWAYESRGARSCAGWQEFRQDEAAGYPLNASIYQTWIVGYLSGLVAGTGVDFLAGTGNDALYRMVDVFCTENPQLNLAAAGTHVARSLLQQKGMVYSGTQP